MPRRKDNPDLSERWPQFFKDAEAAQVLLEDQTFQALQADCRRRVDQLSYDLTHGVPCTDAAIAQNNFERGQLSVFEYIEKLGEELKEWKEAQR